MGFDFRYSICLKYLNLNKIWASAHGFQCSCQLALTFIVDFDTSENLNIADITSRTSLLLVYEGLSGVITCENSFGMGVK